MKPASQDFAFLTLEIHNAKILAEVELCMADHERYGFGSKVDPLELQPDKFSKVDCSGFFRWEIYHGTKAATGVPFYCPDGSIAQHRWLDRGGFKKSTYEAGFNHDNILRVAVLAPTNASDNIGHILFLLNGKCIESHGSVGPDNSRDWGSKPWMKLCDVYVLSVTDSELNSK